MRTSVAAIALIRREQDGRAVSPMPKRFRNQLGWDLFVSYAHEDDRSDGWVSTLVQAIRAERCGSPDCWAGIHWPWNS